MKIVALSDLHGCLLDSLPTGDILVIAGDICPATDHSIDYQKWWLEHRFNLWLESLPFKDIVGICGNHDFIFQEAPFLVPELKWNYLQQSDVIIDNIKFYGYPHTPIFYNWAFNCTTEQLKIICDGIPSDTNVLITHGPAYGILDCVTESNKKLSGNLGDINITNRIKGLPNLKLHISGHIHSGHGMIKHDNIISVNASCINENYQEDYDIITVEI